ncbi:MAG: undecaprenyl-diphosphate phosphatase [Muribaculaceae bacterium]|nr:undecaprenyl-diphosphate phosphatase [Muribaculaceae bacterium]MDE6521351.1 undecaprenyl-diphosphate phosphatase [Muribaculaceae bacterium]MDE6786532.1 undecaprenyl-diphosphate phosphatase [Muribaculaceae bacterium]
MDWLDALILGIVQGLAEYLPISSSGHLVIFREILGLKLQGDDALQFDVILHAATVLSTIVILWPMFWKLCKSFFTFSRDDDFWYVVKILVSCIPIAIVGFCFKDIVESVFVGNLTIVGICLLATACLLTFAHYSDRLMNGKMKSASRGRDITFADAITIGVAQAVAVLPGLSRSGTTIATGILIGDKRDKVASFSFLMVIIPIVGESLLSIKDILQGEATGQTPVSSTCLLIGFLAAFVVGCIACKWMLNLVKKGKLVWFAVYCLVVGILCLVW